MKNVPKTLKKGGYSGDQDQIVRFRASAEFHEKLQDLAHEQGLCLAALVRRLVLTGLDKTSS
jgi:hypothetical protein